ncbi:class I adenylate-forming enzyme family protein [Henriciella pelagia]|uniref:Acyl-CoA synthetase n=1 Tax=Henriciella pelagia TaxID=1977912 RepID=A0ABQ1JLF5_9PROT|nr:AMP-binding protein [Henriciella pelagia]GGB69246.1 acyl-CoA synthetase [Henriciella pelagia]
MELQVISNSKDGSRSAESMRASRSDQEILPRDLVRRTGLNNPNKVAYVCGDRSASWGEMHAKSDRLSAALLANGVAVGDAVGIMAPECIEVYEHFFACMKIGAIRVGVNRRFVDAELRHVFVDSGMKCLFVHASCGELLKNVREDLKSLKILTVGFGGEHDFDVDLEAILDDVVVRPELPPLSGCDPLMYSYTSGTTGSPKGAVLTHRAVTSTILHALAEFGFVRDDRFFLPTGNAWVAVVLAFLGLGNGMTHIIADGDYDRSTFFDIVKDQNATVFLLAPTMLNWALEDNRKTPFDLSSVRLIIYGSSPATPTLIKRVHETFAKDMINVYALTETTWGGVTFLSPEDHRRALTDKPELLKSVGRVASHFEISIRDEDGEPVETGEPGEIWLRGPTIMAHYLNLPEQTEEVLREGWLRTNDVGRLDEDGYVYLLDRQKFMIVSGGVNVYPAAVEAILVKHPGVADVCVVGVPHPEWGEAVVAVVRKDEGHENLAGGDLIEFCRDKLNRPSTPKHFVFVEDDFPRTTNFKVRKKEVQAYVMSDEGGLPWDCSEGAG